MESNLYSLAQENYLKAIYMLSSEGSGSVSTQLLSRRMRTSAASVSGMVDKLARAGYLRRRKYKGVEMSAKGAEAAVAVIRRHRLWEVFLHEKLGFDWSEVHELAEELEHVRSEALIGRLEAYLNYPKRDPHGDPIPSATGEMPREEAVGLVNLKKGARVRLVGTRDSSPAFLKHMDGLGMSLGVSFKVCRIFSYDGAYEVEMEGGMRRFLSRRVAENLLVNCEG